MRFKKGELVYVRTRGLHPQIDGAYTLTKVRRLSNFPYRIMHDGEETLLEKNEVFQITYPLPAYHHVVNTTNTDTGLAQG